MNIVAPLPKRPLNPWPVAIFVYFLCFGAAVVGCTVFALRQKNDLVTANYYDEEIRFQKQVDRLHRTAPLRSQIFLHYQPVTRAIAIQLPGSQPGASGSMRLYRPSDARADVEFKFATDDQAAQIIPVGLLQPGRWRISLTWLVDGADYYFEDAVVIENQLTANGSL